MPEKQLCELTVITVGYHRLFITFVFSLFFLIFKKTVFLVEKQSYKKVSQSYNYTSYT